jgi:hypothetical protein
MSKHIYCLVLAFLFVSVGVLAQPTITSFSPTSGPVGTSVVITGTNFNATPASNTVFFGATKATVTLATTTQLTVTVPAGATYQPITVLVGGLIAFSKQSFSTTYPGDGSINTGSFLPKTDFTTGTNPNSIAVGDLDGDGKADLIVANFTSNTISIFRNTSSAGSVSYAAKIDLTSGTGTGYVAVGDLDGDGKLDLAVANYTANTVSVFRNTSPGAGTISYAARVNFTTGSNPRSVAIGDLDGDGKADLATTNYLSHTVSVFRNTSPGAGTISYAAKVDYSTGASSNPHAVAIGDMDDDGKADLAVANYTTNLVSVFRNTSLAAGTIAFATKVDFTSGTRPASIAIGDLDGDGKIDLAAGNRTSKTVSVFRNTSAGIGNINYAAKVDLTTANDPRSVAMGDLDGDGKADLAASNGGSQSVSVFKNTSTGVGVISYAAKVDFGTGTTPISVAIGDADGDGKADLAMANYGSTSVSVIIRKSPPTIASFTPACGPVGTSVTITGTGFNATPASNTVFFGATKAAVTAATATSLTVTVPVGATYQPITVLVNGLLAYSKLPFATSYAGGGSFSSSSFDPVVTFNTDPTVSDRLSTAIGDLDGDGKADVVVVNPGTNYLSVYRNTSSGAGNVSFAPRLDFTTSGDAATVVTIGDLDGDGKGDLIVANAVVNTISVFRNISIVGTISFAPKSDFATGIEPRSIAIGDVDGDGKSEIGVANYLSNTVSVFKNTSTAIGSISYAAKIDFATGAGPTSVAMGDLDADGKFDLAVANHYNFVSNTTTNTISVLRNTSTTLGISYAAKVDLTTDIGSYIVATGDLDDDGKVDLAVTNLTGNSVSVFRNTSTGIGNVSLAPKVDFTNSSGSIAIASALGDLDGDCKADLALSNNLSPVSVSVFKNTSVAGTISFAANIDYPTGEVPVSIAIGDMDGDGKADLVGGGTFFPLWVLRRNNTGLPGGRTAGPAVATTEVKREEIVSKEKVFAVYPNPVRDLFTVSLGTHAGIKDVRIYQMNGLQLTAQTVSGDEAQFNVANYTQGMYLVKVIASDGTSQVIRFIKE